MRKFLGVALACLAAVCVQAQSAQAAKTAVKSDKWLEDLEAAKAEAVAFKQPVFALFTGSDWCPYCIKFNNEVLSSKKFKKFAAENLILLEVDVPQLKKMPAKVKKQNEALFVKYGVRSVPTVMLLDSEGKELAKREYEELGDEAFLKVLKELLNKAGFQVTEKPEAAKPAAQSK